ncbi:MAG: hypothetical protein EBS06_04925 [Proteobacteria bacterium]|nr:hypothetical protein [Pseudomonadota bacterium]
MNKKTTKNLSNSYYKTPINSDEILELLESDSESEIPIKDHDIVMTLLDRNNEDDFLVFKKIITNEKVIFNSWLIANSFEIPLLKNYCNNFQLKIQLTLAEDPDVKLPAEIIKVISKYSSTQLALNRFFDLEENDKKLRELFKMITENSNNSKLGYFKFEDTSKNLLGGGALIHIAKKDEQTTSKVINKTTKKVDLILHIIDQNRGIGDLALKRFFKIAFEESDIDEIWSRSAKEDLEITNFMCKHGMTIKDDEESGAQFYFIDKKMWEAMKN